MKAKTQKELLLSLQEQNATIIKLLSTLTEIETERFDREKSARFKAYCKANYENDIESLHWRF